MNTYICPRCKQLVPVGETCKCEIMTTLEGNKLIAKLMGLPTSILHNELCYADWDGMHEVKYHSSWDWLMPAWEKLRHDVWYSFSESYPKGFMLYVENWKTSCFNNCIGDARNAVIDGIQWYNQNKKQ